MQLLQQVHACSSYRYKADEKTKRKMMKISERTTRQALVVLWVFARSLLLVLRAVAHLIFPALSSGWQAHLQEESTGGASNSPR